MKRGRPEQVIEESPVKFVREYKTNYIHGDVTVKWNYDLNKYDRGPVSVDINYSKDYDLPKRAKIDNSKYVPAPVVMVYKTSENKNARYKLKVWHNKSIDQILSGKNNGFPDDVIILELGIGNQLIEEYKEKYKNNLK